MCFRFDTSPLRCDVPADLDAMDEAAFFDWCQSNQQWRIERTAKGEIEIMSPAGWETGGRNAEITYQLMSWARQDGRGIAAGSSTGYILPNGASLGWLIDPQERCVHIYLPEQPPQVVNNPATVIGEGQVEGFVLDLERIFDFEI